MLPRSAHTRELKTVANRPILAAGGFQFPLLLEFGVVRSASTAGTSGWRELSRPWLPTSLLLRS